MIARIQKSMKTKDGGFTLIELLVVMIIIGILAAIAVPVFLNQRKKAVDTSARSDVSNIGKEMATYYVDASGAVPVVSASTPTGGAARRYEIAPTATGAAKIDVARVSLKSDNFTDVAKTGTGANDWCVAITYKGGSKDADGVVSYSAANGLQDLACVAATPKP